MSTSFREVVKTKEMLSKEVEKTSRSNVKQFLGLSINKFKDKNEVL